MNTKKNRKSKKNKTFKNKNKPIFKVLNKNYSLYASKKYSGQEILNHSHELDLKFHKKCITDNLTWLGTLDVAKSYKTADTQIYKWNTKNKVKLIVLNNHNRLYFKQLFLKNKNKIIKPLLNFSPDIIQNIKNNIKKDIDIEYLEMNNNEKCWYEFAFAYGYIDIHKQFNFLRFLKYLLKHKYIKIELRDGSSLLKKIIRDEYYYKSIDKLPIEKQNLNNRISFYKLNQIVLTNLCNLLPANINGVYQPDASSFWFPNLLVYKMNIEEFVLFNPYKNLKYDKVIE